MNVLVTVVVISYNSEAYIIDTLNSVYNQTYDNIELIVADDCSEDSTFIITSDWININNNRFESTLAFKQSRNVGSCQNSNDAIKNSNGSYIKLIAADDILHTDCIESHINNILTSDSSIKFQFSKLFTFENNDAANFNDFDNNNELYCFYNMTAKEQYKKLLEINFVAAPTMFFEREAFVSFGMFNSKYDIFEDLPLWITVTKTGEKLYLLDKYLVKYRIHNNSITGYKSSNFIIKNPRYFISQRKYFFSEMAIELIKNLKFRILFDRLSYFLYGSIVIKNGNINNSRNRILKKIIYIISPSYNRKILKRLINRK